MFVVCPYCPFQASSCTSGSFSGSLYSPSSTCASTADPASGFEGTCYYSSSFGIYYKVTCGTSNGGGGGGTTTTNNACSGSVCDSASNKNLCNSVNYCCPTSGEMPSGGSFNGVCSVTCSVAQTCSQYCAAANSHDCTSTLCAWAAHLCVACVCCVRVFDCAAAGGGSGGGTTSTTGTFNFYSDRSCNTLTASSGFTTNKCQSISAQGNTASFEVRA